MKFKPVKIYLLSSFRSPPPVSMSWRLVSKGLPCHSGTSRKLPDEFVTTESAINHRLVLDIPQGLITSLLVGIYWELDRIAFQRKYTILRYWSNLLLTNLFEQISSTIACKLQQLHWESPIFGSSTWIKYTYIYIYIYKIDATNIKRSVICKLRLQLKFLI